MRRTMEPFRTDLNTLICALIRVNGYNTPKQNSTATQCLKLNVEALQ
jgi:hypothetical protein